MIVHIYRTLKDAKRVFFVTEFIKGKDLFDVIREIGLLSEIDAKFYV